MSVETSLDSALGIVLFKARSGLGGTSATPTPGGGGTSGGGGGATSSEPPRPATVNFEWSGGGAAIIQTSVDPILAEVPFPCRIVWVHLRAGDAAGNPTACNAQVDVSLSQFETFGGRTPLYASGSIPGLVGQFKNDIVLTGWKIDLTTGDTITARILSFSGTATWLTLTLLLRPTEVPISLTPIVDTSGNQLVDSSGNTLVLKGS